jgi:hypothetical protein
MANARYSSRASMRRRARGHRVPDAIRREAAGGLRRADGGDDLPVVRRAEEEVAPGLEAPHRRLALAPGAAHAVHEEGVRHHEAVVAQFASEEVAQDGRGEGGGRVGRQVRRERGVRHVGGHHETHPDLHGAGEGHEVPLQFRAGRVHAREVVVAVGEGAAVAGEVLGAGEDAAALAALDPGGREARHEFRVVAEAARSDDGVARLVVEVEHGREGGVDADLPALDGGRPPEGEGRGLVAERAEGHGRREAETALDLLADAALHVAHHEDRPRRRLAEPLEEAGRDVEIPAEEEDPSHAVLGDGAADRLEPGVVLRQAHRDGDEAGDLVGEVGRGAFHGRGGTPRTFPRTTRRRAPVAAGQFDGTPRNAASASTANAAASRAAPGKPAASSASTGTGARSARRCPTSVGLRAPPPANRISSGAAFGNTQRR